MRIFMILFYLLLIVIGASFAALNASSVQINFYVTKVTMPISILMALTFVVGLILGLLLFLPRYWRLKRKYSKIQNQLNLTEKEIKNLRSIPLQNEP